MANDQYSFEDEPAPRKPRDYDDERPRHPSRNRRDDHDDEEPRRRNPPVKTYPKSAIIIAAGFGLLTGLLIGFGGTQSQSGSDEKKNGSSAPRGDMSLKEFILQKPAKPTSVQVDCSLDTYYNYGFSSCAETHYSFCIEDRSTNAHAYGYAAKTSEHGRRLYELLKDGSKIKTTLLLRRLGPEGEELPAKDDSCFTLSGIVQGKN